MKQLEQVHETKRLIIRPFKITDADALYDILSDEAVSTFIPLPLMSEPEEAVWNLKAHFAVTLEKRDYFFAICLKEDDRPIGYAGVDQIGPAYDFGYALRSDFWNNGITTEAAWPVLQQLKQDGYAYLTAIHDADNPASGKVMEKLGFKYHYSYDEIWEKTQQLVTFRMYQMNFDESVPIYEGYKERYPWYIEAFH